MRRKKADRVEEMMDYSKGALKKFMQYRDKGYQEGEFRKKLVSILPEEEELEKVGVKK